MGAGSDAADCRPGCFQGSGGAKRFRRVGGLRGVSRIVRLRCWIDGFWDRTELLESDDGGPRVSDCVGHVLAIPNCATCLACHSAMHGQPRFFDFWVIANCRHCESTLGGSVGRVWCGEVGGNLCRACQRGACCWLVGCWTTVA